MHIKLIPLLLLTAVMLVRCSPVTLPATVTLPVFTPAASPVNSATDTPAPTLTDTAEPTLTPTEIIEITATPTPEPCAWNWAYGDASDLQTNLQQALEDAQIAGVVKAQSSGETGGENCSYHEQTVTAVMTIYVVDTTDLSTLTDLATRIEALLKSSTSQYGHTPSLTNGSVLIFKGPTGSTAKECRWQFDTSTCQE